MDIEEERETKTITVEPIEDPVRRPEREREPARQPVEVPQREKVPA